ncbi:MAG: DUF4292 domain-containing protein [Saprospiraceae bacterium]|nr:DUF4292 domain-containing protein [Saprospiraceae bacterium]
MIRSWAIWLILISSGLLFSYCGTAKKSTETSNTYTAESEASVMRKVKNQRLGFDRFNAKAKVKYQDEENRFSFIVNLRMKKDAFVWLNASFLGFEVARVLIRPDSIFALNRYEKTYVQGSLSDMDKSYKIPVEFDQLQELILGNPIILQKKKPNSFKFVDGAYEIDQDLPLYRIAHWINPQFYKPTKIKVEDKRSGYQVEAELADFKGLEKSSHFSYFRHYIIKNHNTHFANIQLNFTDIDTSEEKKIPFEIPAHYTRID